MATPAHSRYDIETAQAVALVEAYVGSLFDYLPSALVITDTEGVIVRVNPRAERLLGADDVLGRSIRSVLPFVSGPSEAGVWVGTLPGLHAPPLRVRCGRIACPPVGALVYVLEEASPMLRQVSSVARTRSRFAPSRWARL